MASINSSSDDLSKQEISNKDMETKTELLDKVISNSEANLPLESDAGNSASLENPLKYKRNLISEDHLLDELASYDANFEHQKFGDENDVSNYHVEDSERSNESGYHVPLSPIAISCLREKLDNEETFSEAISNIMVLSEKGEFTNENANSFYTMMECIHNHVATLHSNEIEHKKKFQSEKGTLIEHLNNIMGDLTKIENVHSALSLQNNFDNFSLTQQENIKLWEENSEKFRSDVTETIEKFECKVDESQKNVNYLKQLEGKIHELQELNDNLQEQLKEAQNKIIIMQSDQKKKVKRLDKELASMKKDVQTSQESVLKLKKSCSINEIQIKELYKINRKKRLEDELGTVSSVEAFIIALASTFLYIWHGATLEAVCSHLQEFDPTISIGVVENTLRKYSTVFEEEVGVEANLMRNWYFIGFQT